MSLSNSTADSSTAEIVAALRRGEASAAESLCREQLESDPASVEHLLLLGHALMLDRRYGEAETALRNALDAAPESPRVLEALGSALAQQRQFDEAIGVFEKAVKLDPEAVNAHRKLGQALAAVGRGIEADEAFEKYFEKDPDAAAVAAGGEHMAAGREDEAIECFRRALKANPDNVDAMRFLAAVYLKQEKNLRDAEALLEKATRLAPDFGALWLDLGQAYQKRARRMEAIEAYKRAVELERRLRRQ